MAMPVEPWNGIEVHDDVHCQCGLQASLWVCWNDTNPGRRFWRCPHSQEDQCSLWEWHDEEYAPHINQMFLSLKRSEFEANSEIFRLNMIIERDSIRNYIKMEEELIEMKLRMEKLAEAEREYKPLKRKYKNFQMVIAGFIVVVVGIMVGKCIKTI